MVNYVSVLDPTIEGFKAGMAELGYIEGENVTYIYHGVIAPDSETIKDEIRVLLASDVDLLFTLGNLPAKEVVEGTDTPVVFGPIMQPVIEGVVESLRQPGWNVTGVTNGQGTSKALEWLVLVTPEAKRIYLPYNPEDEVSIAVLDGMQDAPSQLGIELVLAEVSSVEETVAAIENLPDDVDAIFRIPSPTLDPRNGEISQAAIERGIPLGAPLTLDESVLITYGADFFEVGRQIARLVHQIRRGVEPDSLPVETSEFFLTINLRTAEAIGLDIPDEILEQADVIIR